MNRSITGIYIGLPREIENSAGQFITGIFKHPIAEMYLSKEAIEGDGVANTVNHGGPDRVLCLYAGEHYHYWEQECGFKLPPSAFGENLTATGMREADVCIGDIYRIGEAVVQVSQGRYPCYTISRRNEYDPMLLKVLQTGYTGYFFRVLEEGMIRGDSLIELMEQHPSRVTVEWANTIILKDPGNDAAVRRLLDLPELAQAWKNKLESLSNSFKVQAQDN